LKVVGSWGAVGITWTQFNFWLGKNVHFLGSKKSHVDLTDN